MYVKICVERGLERDLRSTVMIEIEYTEDSR